MVFNTVLLYFFITADELDFILLMPRYLPQNDCFMFLFLESMNRPKQTVNTCCDRRKTTVNLRRGTLGVINNLSDSVEVLQEPTEWNSTAECSSTALVKVSQMML